MISLVRKVSSRYPLLNSRIACAGLLVASAIFMFNVARADVIQTLDSVDIHDGSLARSMKFDDARAERLPQDYDTEPVVSASAPGAFSTCQRAPNGDLICIDSDTITRWVTTTLRGSNNVATKSVERFPLFTCASLGLDSRRGNPACISFAVDVNGAIWIGGRKSSSAYSILKISPIAPGGACPTPDLPIRALSGPTDFCPKLYATGRPLITDMFAIDGEVAKAFKTPRTTGEGGVLVIERREQAAFVPDRPDPVTPIIIASGKTAWGLAGNEGIFGAALLQTQDSKVNYIVATTDTGRILAKRSDTTAVATTVFNIPANRTDLRIDYSQCNGNESQKYGIRVRSESGRAYVSDRDCHQVLSLTWFSARPTAPDASYCGPVNGPLPPLTLCNVREDQDGVYASPAQDVPENYVDVTLSTGEIAPNGVSVAPGIPIDFNDCPKGSAEVCPLAPDGADTGYEDNLVGAYVKGISLAPGSKSNMVVYRITGIPDCRKLLHRHLPICAGTVVVAPDGSGREFLNVYPLLPDLIKKQLTAVDATELLISPMYVAKAPDYTFEAFFGRTEPDVHFRDYGELTVDVGDLAGKKLGCGDDPTASRPDTNWDIITTISERYPVASEAADSGARPGTTGPEPASRYVDMLANISCVNPSNAGAARWSLYPYNLKLDVAGFKNNGLLSPFAVPGADVFALLLRSLYNDLGLALDSTARIYVEKDNNTPGTAPLSIADGNTLSASWFNGDDKLTKCIEAAYDKRSAADQACQAFSSQLTSFRSELAKDVPANLDKANRIGEVKLRVEVIFHVLEDHFLPSIPLEGFNP